jgi:hypothetical protein
MDTIKTKVRQPLARIYRPDQECDVMPACETLRRALGSIAHRAVRMPDNRLQVFAVDIRDHLRGYGIHAVAVNSRNQPSQVGQVAVCTPAGLAHHPVQVAWLDLVIVVNALQILSKEGRLAVGHAYRARLFGLVVTGRCRRPSTVCGPKPPSRIGWRWICNEINKPRHARQRSPAFIKRENDPKRQLPCYSVKKSMTDL